MRKDFRLTTINSLEDIERSAVAAVHAHRAHDLGIFATALDKRRGALRDAAFMQMLLTWARLSPDATLKLLSHSNSNDAEVLTEACGYSPGIAILSVAGSIKVGPQSISRAIALDPGKERINAGYLGDYDRLVKGRTVDLLCVSGAERQYLKPLFSAPSPQAVKDKFDLKATVRALAARSHPGGVLDESTVSALATLTHELFENTQDHAITDISGKPYRRHVEAIFAGWLMLSDDDTQNDLNGNKTLQRYWKALAQRQVDNRQVAGLCFSFLDSGPGMAARLLGRDYVQMTSDEEAQALRKCLRQRVTTKSAQGTGGGFHEVLLEAAQASGFVRVRSGRQAIFRCFEPGDRHTDVCERFEDWYPDKPELLRVAGTLISVFIPFPRPLK